MRENEPPSAAVAKAVPRYAAVAARTSVVVSTLANILGCSVIVATGATARVKVAPRTVRVVMRVIGGETIATVRAARMELASHAAAPSLSSSTPDLMTPC